MRNFLREYFPTLLFAVPAAALWWYLATQPATAMTTPVVRWQLTETQDVSEATRLANGGWEPYAVTIRNGYVATTYHLRRRL